MDNNTKKPRRRNAWSKETTQKLQIKDLLTKGYFPKELPPCFSTKKIDGIDVNQILKSRTINPNTEDVRKIFPKDKICSKSNEKITYKNAELLIKKKGSSRRRTQTPHLIPYLTLYNIIETKGNELFNIIKNSKYSLSSPVDPTSNEKSSTGRAFDPKQNWVHTCREKLNKRPGFSHSFSADIQNFYGSIYTHSIPWFLHGKDKAKLDPHSATLGNQLDTVVRKMHQNQTIGIPVGPDPSFLIAESFLSKIDEELLAHLNEKSITHEGTRYMDDYEFYFTSFSDAEAGLSILQKLLYKYELTLNSEKTEIKALPSQISREWVSKIKSILPPRKKDESTKHTLEEIQAIFQQPKHTTFSRPVEKITQETDKIAAGIYDTCTKLCLQYPQDHVLQFTIGYIIDNAEELGFLTTAMLSLNIISTDHSLLPYLIQLMEKYKGDWYSHPTFKEKASRTIALALKNCTDTNNHHEIVWSLFYLLIFQIELSPEIAIKLSNKDNPYINILLLNLINNKLLRCEETKSKILKRLSLSEFLFGEHWLTCLYATQTEALSNDASKEIKETTLYKELTRLAGSMYKPLPESEEKIREFIGETIYYLDPNDY